MSRGNKFQPLRTGDVQLDAIQREISDTFAQLEEQRRGLVAADVMSVAAATTLGEQLFVRYTGRGGESLMLPLARLRGPGKGQLLVLEHTGTGTLTIASSGTDTVSGGRALQLSPGALALLASDGDSKWLAVVKNDARDWSAYRHGGTGLGAGETWYLAGAANAGALAAGAPTANVLRAVPFVAPERGVTVDKLSFDVTIGAAGNGRVGIYDNVGDSVLYPGALVADGGAFSTAGAGVQTANTTAVLRPGRPYYAVYVGSAAPTIQCIPLAGLAPLLGVDPAMTAPRAGVSVAFAFGALPATFPGGGAYIAAAPVPAIAYRVTA